MADSDRLLSNGHNYLNGMESDEEVYDPFFGFMNSQQLLMPYEINETALMFGEEGSQLSLLPSPENTPQGFRSSPVDLTLMDEAFIITDVEAFDGEDLPEVTAREIELLMHQPEEFYFDVEEQQTTDMVCDLQGDFCFIDQLNKIVSEVEQDGATEQSEQVPPTSAAPETTLLWVTMPAPPSGASGNGGDQP